MYDCNIVSVQKILFLKNRPCSTEMGVLKNKIKTMNRKFCPYSDISTATDAFPQLCQSSYTHENKTFPARIKDQNPRYSKEAT